MEETNRFTKHFIKKTDIELLQITNSNKHTSDAKKAASNELKRRKLKINTKSLENKKPTPKSIKPSRKKLEIKLLIFGIALLLVGCFNIPKLFVNHNSLAKIEGTINNVSVEIEKHSSRNRYGVEETNHKSILVFDLKEFYRDFQFVEHVGYSKYNSTFNNLKYKLQTSKKVKIFIKRNEYENYRPKIYRMDINDKTVVSLNSVRFENILMILTSLTFGILIIRRYLKKHPEQLKQLMSKMPVGNTA